MLKPFPMSKVKPPSLIKWTGSKRSQAAEIYSYFPNHDRYIEPFLGGGSLLFLASCKDSIGNDLYKPLISFWDLVKNNPTTVIENYRDQWTSLQNDLPAYFYEVRERFNERHHPLDLAFLSRTCVNGIIRFNAKGEFNNSFHLSRKGMQPDKFAKTVIQWHEKLKKVTFTNLDYREILAEAREGDFVYMDPPYANNKQRYCADISTDELYDELEKLNRKGVKWAMSFDGSRADKEYEASMPSSLYERKLLVESGLSAVKKVLSGVNERVFESLYVNY